MKKNKLSNSQKSRILICCSFILVTGVYLISCNKKNFGNNIAQAATVTSGVTINATDTLLLLEGRDTTLSFNVVPDSISNPGLTWRTSDSSVATVKNGTVSAKSVGYTTITANPIDGSAATAAIVVSVVDHISAKITSVAPLAASAGDTIKIIGTGFGANTSNVQVSFNGIKGTVYSVFADTVVSVIVPNGFSSGADTLFVNGDSLLFHVTRLASVPDPTVLLSFEGNLNVAGNNPQGVSASYLQGAGSALTYISGVKGQAVYLNGYSNTTWGANQAISLTPATAAQYNELTIACWVQYPGGSANATNGEWIFSQALSRGNLMNLQAAVGWPKVNGNALSAAINFEPSSAGSYASALTNAGFTTYSAYGFWSGKAIPTSGWHQVCMTVSKSTDSLKLYLDGVLVNNVTYFNGFGGSAQAFSLPSNYDLTLYNADRCYIGSEAYGSDNEPSFQGGIDEFKIYNSVLSSDQIYTLFYKRE